MGARAGDPGPTSRAGRGAARAGMTEPSDRELVAAAQAGDRGALDSLLGRHVDRLHHLCRRMTGNDADAADATQEALIAIVRGLPRFDGRAAFSTWAYRVAANACLDELRRRRRRPRPGREHDVASGVAPDGGRGEGAGAGGSAPGSAGDDPAQRVVDRLAVDGALSNLAPEVRAAVVLRDVCGLDYSEIATTLGIPGGTVRSRISRGRAAVAAALSSPAPPPAATFSRSGNRFPRSRRPTR
ncbi:MAG: RNA polymerase sigma factor [Acidimicrobiales bacterium]